MTNSAQTLRRAVTARQLFLAAVDAAARELAVELQLNCGVTDSEIDFKALDGAITDGVSDMLSDAFYRLREEARDEESAQAAIERRADLADYNARVA